MFASFNGKCLLFVLCAAFIISCAAGGKPGGIKAKSRVEKPLKLEFYKPDSGPFAIETSGTLVLHDKKRNKDLDIKVTFPAEKTRCPLIVWSHGAGGSKDTYTPLIRHWASHGYICIQPTHSDSIKGSSDRGKGRVLLKGLSDWESRPKDIACILDSLGDIERSINRTIDPEKIGVGGHSFGAHTSQLLAGARVKIGKELKSHADPRPKAFLLISPQGSGGHLDRSSWTGIKRPFAVITGTNDKGRKGEPYTWRMEPFMYGGSEEKYLFIIKDAYHGFGGIAGKTRFPSSGPDNEQHVLYVKTIAIAFWDAFVSGEERARSYLRSEVLSIMSQGKVTAETEVTFVAAEKPAASEKSEEKEKETEKPAEIEKKEPEEDQGTRTALNIPYLKADGWDQDLTSLDLYAPGRGGNFPVVVFVHGGGWSKGDKSNAGAHGTKAEYFTSQGFMYISINYRLVPKADFEVQAGDVAFALSWVYTHADKFGGDPSRILLMGHSAGAHLAALASLDETYLKKAKKPLAIIRGVILLDGAGYDIPMQMNLVGSPASRVLYTRVFGNDEDKWKAASPVNYAVKGKKLPPFLIIHAGMRYASEFQSLRLANVLKQAGARAETYHAQGKNHATVNRDIGTKKDPVTEAIMKFIKTRI